MDVVYRCCCGLDVHKKIIAANLLRKGVEGKEDIDEVRKFGTTTKELLALSDWLKAAGCTHVAMESTGVYWKPIYNILEPDFAVILVNARHIKYVPGRKTDVEDCQWIGQLLQCGLLKASFIPPKPIRELRDLTRQRRKLVQQRSAVVNRIQKVLEDANIKLCSVATDVLGKSGLDMIRAMIRGEDDPEKLSSLARGRLRVKKEELRDALEGRVTDHHRFLLQEYLREIEFFDEMVDRFTMRIEMRIQPFFENLPLLDTIPGINLVTAEEIIAEIGVNMEVFPTVRHLCSWAGMCPGNNESAGKRKGGKTTRGSKWLRAALSEAAWSASRTKGTYLAAQYRRHAKRIGKKRAIIAVGHSILTMAYCIMKNKESYKELGGDYFDKLNFDRLKSYYLKRLESLGCTVEIKEVNEAA